MQIHTGKLCKCPQMGCVYSARKISEVKEHFKTHSDVRNIACDICDYKGKTRQQLTRHRTIHNDTKKYQCPQCPFTSRSSTHLKRHARVHTGAKPFSCPHCDHKCNNLENLRKHVLSTNKHPGKCIYECKFCSEEEEPFQNNFAKEFKAHLVTRHSEMFGNGTEAASYVAGIYDIQDDNTYLNDVVTDIQGTSRGSNVNEQEPIQKLKTNADTMVYQISTCLPPSSSKDQPLDQMLTRFVIPKDDGTTVENLPDSWNLVGRYDESGSIITFQNDSESLFHDHF